MGKLGNLSAVWTPPDPVTAEGVLVEFLHPAIPIPVSYREALFMTEDENGDPMVVACLRQSMTCNYTELEIRVPGPCGHYGCGGLVHVNLN
jgi:hypothetical protein